MRRAKIKTDNQSAAPEKKRPTETPQNNKPHKAGWSPVSAVLVTIIAFLGSQVLAGLVIGLYATLSGLSAERLLDDLMSSTTQQFAYIFLSGLFSLVLIGWFIKHRQIKLSQIGLGRWPRLGDLLPAVVAFGLYFLSVVVILA